MTLRNGEEIDDAVASGTWQCPKCRGSCGEGCTTCCNCGPCRKSNGLAPTHQLIKVARGAGFDNVHDYLVHTATGASPAALLARKTSFAWGTWLTQAGPGTCCAHGGQGESLCPLIHTEASLSQGPGRKHGASLYTRKRLSHGDQGESLVPPYTRGSVSLPLFLTDFARHVIGCHVTQQETSVQNSCR